MTTKKIPVLIDTDPGVDDAIALFMALKSPVLDVTDITTVGGNVPLDVTVANSLKICTAAERTDIAIHAGCDKPLKRPFVDAAWVHGKDGLGGVEFPQAQMQPSGKHAVDVIIDRLNNAPPDGLTIITLGPLTNLATAFLKAPDCIKGLAHVVAMGGAFDEHGPRGNTTPFAEYNIYADPHAAAIVFEKAPKISIVPRETGRQAEIRPHELDMFSSNNPVAKLCKEMVANTITRMGPRGGAMYDPCAVAALLWPEIFGYETGQAFVHTDTNPLFGMTVLNNTNGNTTLYNRIDRKAFFTKQAELLNSQ